VLLHALAVRDRAPILGGYMANDRSTEVSMGVERKKKRKKSEIIQSLSNKAWVVGGSYSQSTWLLNVIISCPTIPFRVSISNPRPWGTQPARLK